MRAGSPGERLSRGGARLADNLLEALVLAFAAWTVVYHVCLLAGVGTRWAGVAWVAALVPAARIAFGAGKEPERRAHPGRRARPVRGGAALRVANVVAAVTAAALFAFTDAPWVAVWSLWILAAAAAVAVTVCSLGRGADDESAAGAKTANGRRQAAPVTGTGVALAWSVALATLSLFLVVPDADDAYYLHQAAWVAAHGRFPLRDTLFSIGELPAVIFPPVSSLEPLTGTIARATGLGVPDLVYLGLTPLVSALAPLALWRLLRTWRAPMVGLALSLSLVFVLTAADEHLMLGRMFVGRIWQGKVAFLVVLVPLLFALLHEYAEAPTRRRLAMLAAVGAAGVGLTTTATFLVPVAAAGALLPLAVRFPAQAAAAFSATAAYPLVTAAVVAVIGGRQADVTHPHELLPEEFVARVLGQGTLAFLALAGILVAPVVLRRAAAGAMAAGTLLLVGLLFAPGLPLVIFRAIGLGQVQWRWMWTIPMTALVGVLATRLLSRADRPLLRAAPAFLLSAAFFAVGTPVWSPDAAARLASAPAWKREPATIGAAEAILAQLQPGESVLAPGRVARTVLVMSGEVTVVAPRELYTQALRDVRGGRARERLVLLQFAENGLGPEGGTRKAVERGEVVRALRAVRVDLACVERNDRGGRRLLVREGYVPAVAAEGVVCLRAPRLVEP